MDHGSVIFVGAAEQARLLASGETTSQELVELYLGRIDRYDEQLNAYRVVRYDAVRAEAADAQRRLDEGTRLPLLGVPIAVKDDIDVAGEVTAWGTSAHGEAKRDDADVVRQLREAGAIIIGKTNCPEMTLWPFTESPTYGPTCNPWNISRAAGGSSGGTAVAVAAGLAALGVGSDGGGSIRTPASWCGVFGLKVQRDRVSLSPHDDGWHGLLVHGPLTRTVADAALFLDVTSQTPVPEGGFTAAASRDARPLRIAITAKSPLGPRAPVGAAQRSAVADAGTLLRNLGHHVVEQDRCRAMFALRRHLQRHRPASRISAMGDRRRRTPHIDPARRTPQRRSNDPRYRRPDRVRPAVVQPKATRALTPTTRPARPVTDIVRPRSCSQPKAPLRTGAGGRLSTVR